VYYKDKPPSDSGAIPPTEQLLFCTIGKSFMRYGYNLNQIVECGTNEGFKL